MLFKQENFWGNSDIDWIPNKAFPDKSAPTRSDDTTAPVFGQSTDKDPPPPVGETVEDGAVVVAITTFSEVIVVWCLLYQCARTSLELVNSRADIEPPTRKEKV